MGNLLACFGAPKKGERWKPSPPLRRVDERCGHLQGSPAAKVAVPVVALEGASVRNCVLHGHDDARFEEADRHVGSDISKRLDVEDPVKQPSSNNPNRSANNSPKKKVTFDMNVRTYDSPSICEDMKITEAVDDDYEELKNDDKPERPGVSVFPSNHRYQNCAISDDENSEEDEEDEFDGEEDDFSGCSINCDDLVQGEESFNSYFSDQLDGYCQKLEENAASDSVCASSLDLKPNPSTGQSVRDRSNYVQPVLNPVENLSQWKEAKAGKVAPKLAMKENVKKMIEVPATLTTKTCQSQNRSPCLDEQEVSVDASLSSWLTPPRSMKGSQEGNYTPSRSYSRSNTSTSLDDRPILGALTVDDLKHANSLSPSPRKSPHRSPDEMPIVGTVGGYWSPLESTTKGIPNSTSKYREDKIVNWHATPFEVRLERALNSNKFAYGDCPAAVC